MVTRPDRRVDAPTTVGVLVVAYEAAATIEDVLRRLPGEVGGAATSVLVADDASTDGTADLARRWAAARPELDIEVVRRARNLGYGGNQKAGYRWALERGVDVVVLLHGDAQYRPEMIPDLVAPIVDRGADAVIGSRMSSPGGARAGGMPLTRRLGNRALSAFQNRVTGARFTEWHSGFRSYRTDVLRHVDLDGLPDGFDFDTVLMLRLLRSGVRVVETPIPTRYADEKSRVQLVRFGTQVVRHTVAHGRGGRRR